MPLYSMYAEHGHRASVEVAPGVDDDTVVVVRYEHGGPETTIVMPPVGVERLAYALRKRALDIIDGRRSV